MFQRYVFWFVSLLALSACGISTPDTPRDPAAAVSLKSFSVDGTGPVAAGRVPIDAAANNGVFYLNWTTNSANDYYMEVYLSQDDVLDSTMDRRIVSRNCGETYSFISGCGSSARIQCTWDSSNRLLCQGESSPQVLTSWLTALPQDAWVLARVCNGLFTKCSVYPVPVQLR